MLNPRKRRAIRLLSEGVTMTRASEALGIHRSTLYRWTEDPAFQAELQTAIDRSNRLAEREFAALKPKAVEVVSAALGDYPRALGAARLYFSRTDRIAELLIEKRKVDLFSRSSMPRRPDGSPDFEEMRRDFEESERRDTVLHAALAKLQNATDRDESEDEECQG